MHDDDDDREGLEEMLRSVARDVSRSLERVTEVDLHELMEAIGVDRARATELVDGATGWLRAQAGDWMGDRAFRDSEPTDPTADHRALRRTGPDPRDLPTDRQGAALAALDSGRWTVEPGSEMLAVRAEGPGPSDALGLVGELRARDWITTDGQVTLVGRAALGRWLDSVDAH